MKTFSAKKETTSPKWYVVDLSGKVLGRAAVEIANILRGKNKPEYTPHVDTGDFVIALNADKIRLTGKKWSDKNYFFHSKYVGHMKTYTAKELLQKHPDMLVKIAVKGMMPKNKLSSAMLTKLKVYATSEHPHVAQQPLQYELKSN